MSGVTPKKPIFTGFSYICIMVDDVNEAFPYYERILGAVPREYFPYWRNKGFFKGMGFMKEAGESEVSVGIMDVPGTRLVLVLMRYHYPEGRKTPIIFKANDMSGARIVSLETENIEEAFAYISAQPDITLIHTDDDGHEYKVAQLSITRPFDFLCFDWEMEGNFDKKQEEAERISSRKFFHFIDKYGLQWEFMQEKKQL